MKIDVQPITRGTHNQFIFALSSTLSDDQRHRPHRPVTTRLRTCLGAQGCRPRSGCRAAGSGMPRRQFDMRMTRDDCMSDLLPLFPSLSSRRSATVEEPQVLWRFCAHAWAKIRRSTLIPPANTIGGVPAHVPSMRPRRRISMQRDLIATELSVLVGASATPASYLTSWRFCSVAHVLLLVTSAVRLYDGYAYGSARQLVPDIKSA